MTSYIQQTIKSYLQADGRISHFTYSCFVGMLETGEATLDDFRAVGGDELAANVEAYQKATA